MHWLQLRRDALGCRGSAELLVAFQRVLDHHLGLLCVIARVDFDELDPGLFEGSPFDGIACGRQPDCLFW